MKRFGRLWYKSFLTYENFYSAWLKVKKHRGNKKDVIKFGENVEENLKQLMADVESGKYKISPYRIMYKNENSGKRRKIYMLPIRDRIVQHALNNILEPIFTPSFIDSTYGCIKGRGQIAGSNYIRKHINKYDWVMKSDIRKFYPTIDQQLLYDLIERKIKDKKILELCKQIIFSLPGGKGEPIGNLFSQLAGNIYLNELDKQSKHVWKMHIYDRYCDDTTYLLNDKEELFELQIKFKEFVNQFLKQDLSYCEVFKTKQGIDFLGYRHFKGYVIMRKRTALKFKRAIRKIETGKDKRTLLQKLSTINSYKGIADYCCSHNLIRSLNMNKLIADLTVKEFKQVGAKPELPICGKKVSILSLFNKPLILLAWKELSVQDRKTIKIQFFFDNQEDEQVYVTFTTSSTIRKQLEQMSVESFPVKATFKKQGEAFYLE